MTFRKRARSWPVLLLLLLVGILPFGQALVAAIAPHYERVREFGAVMSVANQAAAMLSGHGSIDKIERRDGMTFYFWAGQCFVPATLEVLPDEGPPMAGSSTDYRATLGTVQCE